jgi:hypothetical protein
MLRGALLAARSRRRWRTGLSHDVIPSGCSTRWACRFERLRERPRVSSSRRERDTAALRDVLGYRVYRDLRRGWRVTSPNLEQCGLLDIEYESLDEVCRRQQRVGDRHPALAAATPERRAEKVVPHVLLDYLRRELAVKVDYLDAEEQERICDAQQPVPARPLGARRRASSSTQPRSSPGPDPAAPTSSSCASTASRAQPGGSRRASTPPRCPTPTARSARSASGRPSCPSSTAAPPWSSASTSPTSTSSTCATCRPRPPTTPSAAAAPAAAASRRWCSPTPAGSAHDQYFFKRPEKMVAGQVDPAAPRPRQRGPRARPRARRLAGRDRPRPRRILRERARPGATTPTSPCPRRAPKPRPDAARAAPRRAPPRSSSATCSAELRAAPWYHDEWLTTRCERARRPSTAPATAGAPLPLGARAGARRPTSLDATKSKLGEGAGRAPPREADQKIDLLRRGGNVAASDFYSYRYFASEGFLPGYSSRACRSRPTSPAAARARAATSSCNAPLPRHQRVRAARHHLPRGRQVPRHPRQLHQRRRRRRHHRRQAKVCGTCGYLHPITTPPAPDTCERCRRAPRRPLTDLLRLQTSAPGARTHQQRRGGAPAPRATRSSPGCASPARDGRRHHERPADRPRGDGDLAELAYAPAATIWRINLGWRHRKRRRSSASPSTSERLLGQRQGPREGRRRRRGPRAAEGRYPARRPLRRGHPQRAARATPAPSTTPRDSSASETRSRTPSRSSTSSKTASSAPSRSPASSNANPTRSSLRGRRRRRRRAAPTARRPRGVPASPAEALRDLPLRPRHRRRPRPRPARQRALRGRLLRLPHELPQPDGDLKLLDRFASASTSALAQHSPGRVDPETAPPSTSSLPTPATREPPRTRVPAPPGETGLPPARPTPTLFSPTASAPDPTSSTDDGMRAAIYVDGAHHDYPDRSGTRPRADQA